jgi:PleD family two-component response regulator
MKCALQGKPEGPLNRTEIANVTTKMLYVEHDDDNLYMLKTRLERCGDFEVLATEDSEQGCKLAVTERPDVILMDLEMPVMDRWEPVDEGRRGAANRARHQEGYGSNFWSIFELARCPSRMLFHGR